MGKPFIKWVGGKRRLLPQIREVLPESFGTYHEPFVGGGALFWDLDPRKAVLSDANERLVRTYRAVRDDVEGVIDVLMIHEQIHCADHYYEVRAMDIDSLDDVAVASWMIYLNKAGFNGLYRVNKSNGFNVAMGTHKSLNICDAGRLRACSAALQGVELRHCGYLGVSPSRGDLVYFDPPYIGATSFIKYTAGGFGPVEQAGLRNLARFLIQIGVHVILSNSWTPEVRELYAGPEFHNLEVFAGRAINSKGNGRGKVSEALIVGRPR